MTPERTTSAIARRALVSLTITSTAFLGACGDAGGAAGAADFLHAAVGVEASGCSLVPALGTGAIMADERVITSAHTVAGAREISVITADGQTHIADLVGFDPDADLAVLSVPGLDGEPLPLGEARGGESGWVLAWSPSDGAHVKPMTVTKRLAVTIEDIYVDDLVERGAIEIAADISHGDSGAAVLTTDGRVVGIVYATSRARTAGFALNEREVAEALAAASGTPVDAGPCT